MSDTTVRKCTRCGLEFPETTEFFHRSQSGRSGLKSECKECACARTRGYNAAYPEKMREANQKYANAHKAEISENKRRYYQEHREEILALRSPYYFENKDVLLAYRKRYYEENRGRALANKAEYNKTHRSERRAIENKRRARKKNNGGSHAAADIRAQYNEQDGLCLYCGREVGDQYHVDHYIPLAAGGGNGPDNIVIACPRCNCAKQDSHPEEFLARLVP